jgi:hypothetical protein
MILFVLFVVYATTSVATNDWKTLNIELERLWKEAAMSCPNSVYYLGI